MSFNAKSLKPLFSQKKGTIYSLVLLIAVAVMVVGILSVNALNARNVTITPKWVGSSFNQSFNITVSNVAGSAVINVVRITKPNDFVDIYCINPVTTGWTCATNGTKQGFVYVEFTGGTIAAGASDSFNITSTAASAAGDYTFQLRTEDDAAAINSTNLNNNVSVDTRPPLLVLMNVSDGTRILSSGEHLNGSLFLSNSTGRVTILFNATDNESSVHSVTLYYNATNSTSISEDVILKPNHQTAGTYDLAYAMSNLSFGPGSLWNATLDGGNILNGTRIFFTVVANDTVRNGNVSNSTYWPNSGTAYNFTIDSAAPRFEDVQVLNASQLTTNTAGNAINTTKTFGSLGGLEYIINSSLLLNVSALVSDGGGSGVVRVQIMNRTGNFVDMNPITGTNGSSGQTTWNLSLYNITDLGQRVGGFNGDGLYNLSFRTTDNVSNVVNNNFTVEVDDAPPTGSVSTNITINGKLSEGNVTLDISTNASFNISLKTTNNINNITRNVSVFGNRGLVYNFTFGSGTTSGTSVWNLTLLNDSLVNLSNFCDASTGFTAADGSQCNLQFNFSDVLGRMNSSINLTIAVDGVAPNVSIISPVSLTTNYTGTVLINASVNDSVGPLRNVSFRWRMNSSTITDGDEGLNASNWMPLSLTSGTNSQFNARGYWSATLTISSLTDTNYSIEINATDSGARQNTTTNVSNVIFDSTIPQNITIVAPGSNSFLRVNFTVGINATERISGLRNVSVRLENATHTSPWVGMNQEIVALSSVTTIATTAKYNASRFNLTHVGEQAMNASNGNFTLRLNVTDTAGNQNTTVTINFTIDTVLPTNITVIQPLTGINRTGNFTINLSVNESNIDTVWFRWVNDSSGATAGHRGPWVPMTQGTVGMFNSTFINLTVAPVLLDGNYSIEFNVTDRAGNQNASTLLNSTPFAQLVLDSNAPLIIATGSLAGNTSNLTGNFFVNLTINDTSTWNMTVGKLTTRNINASAFRLENTTFNSSWLNMDFATNDMTNADSNRTNATFTFSSVPNGLYNIRFMVNDTAGNQNNTVQVSNVMLDNVAPSVAMSVSNLSPSPTGGSGISGSLSFNVTITDNLPVNISIGNTNSTQGNRFGVFYRFVSASLTTSWLPMNTTSFSESITAPHKVVFNATNGTSALADGDYQLQINATDSANNQNATVYVDVTLQNGGSRVQAKNLTFFEGIWNGFANSSTDTYTFLMNTTANATCRYSLDTSATDYDAMTSTMTNNVSREHRIAFGPRRDVGASGHTLYYACKDVSGNFTAAGGAASQFPFGIDTRSRWNVTIPGKTDSKWPNYFQAAAGGSANGWSSFVLSTGQLADTTLVSPGTYNVTSVLSSLLSGTAAGNFTRIYAYTASSDSWVSFRVGQTGNTFINFTNQTTYWLNVTTVERLEIN
ncbi:Ig-like domain repeat protein [Candidatus Woesearchaeota archaeon]|nr:Ig-like domain repeat protein [Candidatus Woesearchaeota archaeon]